jgi:hypothetical protein
MGKKKGKDKNKLARMSEEERLRYLQHRAELEEEAKRRKQQLISTFMKVWLLGEEKDRGDLNEESWLELLMMGKWRYGNGLR